MSDHEVVVRLFDCIRRSLPIDASGIRTIDLYTIFHGLAASLEGTREDRLLTPGDFLALVETTPTDAPFILQQFEKKSCNITAIGWEVLALRQQLTHSQDSLKRMQSRNSSKPAIVQGDQKRLSIVSNSLQVRCCQPRCPRSQRTTDR